MWDEGRVRGFARENHGLIERATAMSLGATDHHIRRSVMLGRWDEPHPGVYYLNVTPRTWQSDVAAAILAAGPEAVASHRTAGVIWRLDGVKTKLIELTVPFTDEPVPDGILVHRTRRSVPQALVERIKVTSIERTLLDLARFLPDRSLEKATESALRLRLTTIPAIAQIMKQYGGRGVKGTRKLRRVLDLVDRDRTGSVAELDTLDLIRSAPIPQPVLQMQIPLPTGENAYPDFTWPDRGRIVEVDGFETHSTPQQLESDLRRQNLLMELGWHVRRFSAREIRHDPQDVIRQITRFVNGGHST